ncbi:MAG: phosphoenolpyruvate--protein phosphotransferase [Verrucomicrobiota bacterium]|nr:phosphoenolpyruvate--protein phosphotransferase [Limisphaera sp.]MDW8382800.1 phosphoenolpyruvate--protein phosphotransferase [Verrucomicrobiota bacterium]
MAAASSQGNRILRGIPVSPGVCRGKTFVWRPADAEVPRWELREEEIPAEIERLERALVDTRRQLLDVQRQVREVMGAEQADIFDAHLLVLEDRVLVDEVVRWITRERVNAEYAFHRVAQKYMAALASVEDEYLRERVADMRDVTNRVLNHLLGRAHGIDLSHLRDAVILVAHDLTPSDTIQMDKRKVLGLVTEVGSPTSHAAILARSLGLPALVGVSHALQEVISGQYALLDGFNGTLILNPSDQVLFEYGQLVRRQITLEEKLREVVAQPAVTLDGHRIPVLANIEQADDVEAVQACGAEGVGLFRTEYLYINRDHPPSEEEQYEAYRRVAAALCPQPVIVRTLDLGGDKFLSHLVSQQEMNPFLGWRAIRLCLQQPEMFSVQLRAILRASAEGNVKVMYPMISGVDELCQADVLLEACKQQLRARGQPFNEHLETGAMIEIPSAVLVADVLARRSKFFSIGTNDLIQYALAVDRMNERIAHLYEPTHPAILRLIRMTTDAAERAGLRVGVCGEMAGEPVLVPLLLGLGVHELSAAPPLVPQVKYLIRRIKLSEARELAAWALQQESAAEILRRCRALAHEAAPLLFQSRRVDL